MTLVEMLVATLLSTTVAGALFAVLPLAQRAVLLQPEAADLQQRARVATETLTRDLLEAEAVMGGDCPDRIALRLAGLRRDYYLDDGVLRRADADGADVPVVDDVAGLTCTVTGGGRPSLARIQLRLRARPAFARPGGVADLEIGFDVALRNAREAP